MSKVKLVHVAVAQWDGDAGNNYTLWGLDAEGSVWRMAGSGKLGWHRASMRDIGDMTDGSQPKREASWARRKREAEERKAAEAAKSGAPEVTP